MEITRAKHVHLITKWNFRMRTSKLREYIIAIDVRTKTENNLQRSRTNSDS